MALECAEGNDPFLKRELRVWVPKSVSMLARLDGAGGSVGLRSTGRLIEEGQHRSVELLGSLQWREVAHTVE